MLSLVERKKKIYTAIMPGDISLECVLLHHLLVVGEQRDFQNCPAYFVDESVDRGEELEQRLLPTGHRVQLEDLQEQVELAAPECLEEKILVLLGNPRLQRGEMDI